MDLDVAHVSKDWMNVKARETILLSGRKMTWIKASLSKRRNYANRYIMKERNKVSKLEKTEITHPVTLERKTEKPHRIGEIHGGGITKSICRDRTNKHRNSTPPDISATEKNKARASE